jgi:hypothetical protein
MFSSSERVMLLNKNHFINVFHNVIKLFSEVRKSWTGSHYPSAGSVEFHSRGDTIARVGFKWRHADEVRKKSAKQLGYCQRKVTMINLHASIVGVFILGDVT